VVDSFKFLPRSFRERFAQATAPAEPTPWTPMRKPLREARLALVTTAGVWDTATEPNFDYEREKREPNWGDPSYRVIPRDIEQARIGVGHLHINNADLAADIDIALPIHRAAELERAGEIGALVPSAYSFMGFQGSGGDLSEWREVYGPEVAARMQAEGVDAVLLTPV
jgi:D-proline reductase (dithiol) PrdB